MGNLTRTPLTLGLSIWLSTAALAAGSASVAAVAADPKAYVGKRLAFRGASCVDDPKGGFLCLVKAGGHTLRIEAGALGMSGGDVVAERLTGPCKGKDSLENLSCRFDIEIEPRSAQSETVMLEFEGERVTRLYSGDIEMRVSGKR